MSFREKSAWFSLVSIVGVFVPYFIIVLQNPQAFIGLFAAAVVVLAVLLAGFHLVNAAATASIRKRGDIPLADELDKLIDLRAARVAGLVLVFVVVTWCLGAAVGAAGLDLSTASSLVSISGLQALTAVHTLFAGFVISNLVYYVTIILGYRKLMYG